jgi:drug/metabolite transporter (DMT)-like permease
MSLSFAHNGTFVALIAHGLIGISLVWDKVLLKQPETKNLVSYVFWLGAISIFGLLLIPFGFHFPPTSVMLLAFFTGALQLVALGFYYAALKSGEASQTLAVMGGFSPVATALIGAALLAKPLGGSSMIGFSLLTGAGFVMFFSEKVPVRKMLPLVLIASGAYGFVNVLQKVVFDRTDFISGYVFFTLGTFAGAIALLLRQSWRTQIFRASEEAEPSSRFWYMVNRFIAGVGSFLIFYAISLENPAIVDAITGVRYVIIFIGAYLLTKLRPTLLSENFGGWALFGKALGTLMVIAGLVILGIQGEGESSTTAWNYNDSISTPQATSAAPTHRFQLTCSFRTYFASSVSSK